MLFDFILKQTKPDVVKDWMVVRGRQISLAVIRNHRARRYLLRLRPDGSVRLTIPRRGSVIEGRRFAERNAEWVGRQLEQLPAHPVKPKQWLDGTAQANAAIDKLDEQLSQLGKPKGADVAAN